MIQKTLFDSSGVLNEDYVVCPICGKSFHQLQRHINMAHGMSSDDFMDKYPLNPLVCGKHHIFNSTRVKKSSDIQNRLFEYLKNNTNLDVRDNFHFYSVFLDIAFPEKKVAIEVDGTYFHTDKQTGLDKIQEVVRRYEIVREKILSLTNWKLLRMKDEDLIFNSKKCLSKIYSEIGLNPDIIPENFHLTSDRVLKCIGCGEKLTINHYYNHKSFCCKECHKKYLVEHPEYRKCVNCGKDETRIIYKKRKFCSQECFDDYMNKHAKRIENCPNCGKKVYQLNQDTSLFCDSKCYQEYKKNHPDEYRDYMSKRISEDSYHKNLREENRIEVTCSNCGKKIWKYKKTIQASDTGSFFCNSKCYHDFTRGKKRNRNKIKEEEI